MILVDTSVWIDHLHKKNGQLTSLLESGEVATHPYVIGELACGNVKQRGVFLEHICTLRQLPQVEWVEAITFITIHKLMGKGLGVVDVNLLASCMLTGDKLWSHDKRLTQVANRLNIAF